MIIKTHIVLNQEAIHFSGLQKNWEHPLGNFTLNKETLPFGYTLSLSIDPSQSVQFQEVICELPVQISSSECIYCNGFQSWSESREFEQTEYIPDLQWFAKPLMKNYGDYHFRQIKRKKGFLHSWTYSYARKADHSILFFGSLSEQKAFTLLQWNLEKQTVSFHIDVANRKVNSSFEIFKLWVVEGDENQIFNEWAKLLQMPKFSKEAVTGWTSWYNYYTDINEEKLSNSLNQLKENLPTANFFQIDDGYQTAVGDWLSIDTQKFPEGLQNLKSDIKKNGFQAGIWLAPFICEPKSQLFKNHPEWLLKDKNGKAIKAGYAPHWSGHFYALDFYNQEFQAFLANVLQLFTQKWGFSLLKLDFIYAVCLIPRADKTRAEILVDAMDFIKQHTHGSKLLACGVPLGPIFGMVDYCRIGADIHLKWEHQLLKFFRNRERVSTAIALESILGRHHLNDRFFGNDPDVYILRSHNHQLNWQQQTTVLKLATLSGNLVFNSDELSTYTKEAKELLSWFQEWKDSKVLTVEKLEDKFYKITFYKGTQAHYAFANLTPKEKILKSGRKINPYETLID